MWNASITAIFTKLFICSSIANPCKQTPQTIKDRQLFQMFKELNECLSKKKEKKIGLWDQLRLPSCEKTKTCQAGLNKIKESWFPPPHYRTNLNNTAENSRPPGPSDGHERMNNKKLIYSSSNRCIETNTANTQLSKYIFPEPESRGDPPLVEMSWSCVQEAAVGDLQIDSLWGKF